MCRREVFDAFLRNRAADLGTTLINGLVQKIDTGADPSGPIHHSLRRLQRWWPHW